MRFSKIKNKKNKKMDQFLKLKRAKIGPAFNFTAYIYVHIHMHLCCRVKICPKIVFFESKIWPKFLSCIQNLSGDGVLSKFLRLINEGNACCQNALAYSLLPCYVETGVSTGNLSGLLGSDSRIELASLQWFQALMSEWESPERQHDIAELAQYLLPRLGVAVAAWEGRELDFHSIRVLYRCMPSQPVVLPLPASLDMTSLQALVDCWHSGVEGQRGIIRYGDGSPLVLLQLDRFTLAGASVLKNQVPVQISEDRTVIIPEFVSENSMDVSRSRYKIIAIMVHLGEQQLNGHYVCLWWRGDTLLFHDDHRDARVMRDISPEQCCNMYLLLAFRIQD